MCWAEVSEFEFDPGYYVYFQANAFEKCRNHSILPVINFGSARGVIVIVVGNGHGDMSSNPGRDCLHFT